MTSKTRSLATVALMALCAPDWVFADTAGRGGTVTRLELRIGQEADGTPNRQWLAAAARFNDTEAVRELASLQKPFTPGETGWLGLITRRLPEWETRTRELLHPFGDIDPPERVGVLVGNAGASDAFVAADTTIAFDLARLTELYGAAGQDANADRIDRFFAHEYTHVLHGIWRKDRGLELQSPLEVALWVCLTEGVGNYRSLSARWRKPDGSLSDHAENVLGRLSPIFVNRLGALETATGDDADALMRGLSMGPFEEKWGALPVALWLAEEQAADENALSTWIERGPWGVLHLARRHLPEHLAAELPQGP